VLRLWLDLEMVRKVVCIWKATIPILSQRVVKVRSWHKTDLSEDAALRPLMTDTVEKPLSDTVLDHWWRL
jgi:hypothetical protein